MGPEAVFVLVLLAVVMVLFVTEWLPIDVVTLGLLVALVASGTLTAAQAFSGFASEIIVVLVAVFALTNAIAASGATIWIAQAIAKRLKPGNVQLAAGLLSSAAVLSAFFSNTSATAILMQPGSELGRRNGVDAGRILMPIAYASILGGTCTLIGTSTNLAASGLLERLSLRPIGMFEFLGAGGLIAVAGIVWLLTAGRLFLPSRAARPLVSDFKLQEFLSELVIPEGSGVAGETIAGLKLDTREIDVLAVIRDGRRLPAHGLRKLEAGDHLVVKASRQGLAEARAMEGLVIEAELDESTPADHLRLAEAVLLPQSDLIGRTLRGARFRDRFGVSVLAIYRRGQAYPMQIRNLRLQVGDVLLLQGSEEDLERFGSGTEVWLLGDIARHQPHRRQGYYAIACLMGAVVLAGFGVLPVSAAFVLAVIVAYAAGSLTMEEAYRAVDWRLIVLIGGMTAMGLAMESTGAAGWLADQIIGIALPGGTTTVMAALAVVTIVLTQPLSNAAAALLMIPVAVSVAQSMGVDPRSLAVLVTLSASLSFITPLEPACLLVYGPGRYKFRDFIVAGLPLTALTVSLLIVLVPIFWPLAG